MDKRRRIPCCVAEKPIAVTMINTSFLSLFTVRKPILGMVHLGKLEGQAGFLGDAAVVRAARHDVLAWQKGGIHGLILENWAEDAVTPFIPKKRAQCMARVVQELSFDITVPFGVNVLNNDYPAALDIARQTRASFIQLDVSVDHVISDFTYNEAAKAQPFEVRITAGNLRRAMVSRGMSQFPILGGIHPKHYLLLNKNNTLEESAKQAQWRGIAGIVITKATGSAPLAELFTRVRRVVTTPLGIGSGLTPENAAALLPLADFAIVGTFAKKDGITDNPVDVDRVRSLMQACQQLSYE